MSHRYIDKQDDLAALIKEIAPQARLAIDTEFHRERTYWPHPALIQIGWQDGIALVDPLAVDVSPLKDIFDSDTLIVFHAADQDLDVLKHSTKAVPKKIFDTQLAAGFLGFGIPSLESLHWTLLGIRTPKQQRLTDWLARPLTPAQLSYAAQDVEHLLQVQAKLEDQLKDANRLDWAYDEFELTVQRAQHEWSNDDAWRKVKDFRVLRGNEVSAAHGLAKWRDKRAAHLDRPVRQVLSDLQVVAIAQAQPSTTEELAQVRSVSKGLATGHLGKQILNAVAKGLESKWQRPKTAKRQQVVEGPPTPLMVAWLRQLAHESKIEPSLLATRADIDAFVRSEPESRLLTGWRHEMVGAPLTRLLQGEAAIAFEDGTLVLEERSHQKLGPAKAANLAAN